MEKEVIVVGSGFAGSVMARCFADAGYHVMVIEKRGHTAGNMYDFVDEDGIRIQKYGPHTFHTNKEGVYKFVTRFSEFMPYRMRSQVMIEGIQTPSPFNFTTIDQFYSLEDAADLKRRLAQTYHRDQATVLEMLSCEDEKIRDYARFLFEKDYSQYTAKQWGKSPKKIDPSVLRRVPVLFSYRDTYFDDAHEGLPWDGFTVLLTSMLTHPNIETILYTDALEYIRFDDGRKKVLFDNRALPIIYTGPIDDLFACRYGRLPYRSLYFEYERYDVRQYQNATVIAYPSVDIPYTRITEYTKLPLQNVGERTVIAKEYPVAYSPDNEKGNEPYYPVLTVESQAQYARYRACASEYDNLILCGRLADFKYYNMDEVIEHTLEVFRQIQYRL